MEMKRKKVWIVAALTSVIIFAIITLLLSKNDSRNDDGILKIGFCADGLVIERWQRDQEKFKELAEAAGAEVLVYNANENNEKQNEQIRDLIEQNVDVIVIIAYDKNGIADSVNDAAKAGIKIIAYDRLFYNAHIDAYISFDNVKVGRLMGESLLSAAPEGNYIIINGSPDDNNSSMFRQGYMDVLLPAAASERIQILDDIWAMKWREKYAYDVVSKALGQGERIDAILASNDRLAEAAIRALAEKGIAGDVVVAGHDADVAACQRIVEGTQYMTIYKPIDTLVRKAIEICLELYAGETIASDETMNNGYGDIPYIKLDVVAVTKENMDDTVIADGFHSRESIYRTQ